MLAREHLANSSPLDVVNLAPLMARTAGRSEIIVGLIDGHVAHHPDLAIENVRQVEIAASETVAATDSAAGAHGTFVAGILSARRGSPAPSICPGCTLLVRPIFLEPTGDSAKVPSAAPDELADALFECVAAGARVLNLSVAVGQALTSRERGLEEALNRAARRSTIVVAAAGNQGTLGCSVITRHSWVIPVVACDSRGWPLAMSNLGRSIGCRGLMAPGDSVSSLGIDGQLVASSGTSAAAPFVTGAIALLWSMFPDLRAAEIKSAVSRPNGRRATVVPPILDAWAAYELVLDRRRYG